MKILNRNYVKLKLAFGLVLMISFLIVLLIGYCKHKSNSEAKDKTRLTEKVNPKLFNPTQVLVVTEMIRLSNLITKVYDDDQTQINNIVSQYIPQGFMLTDFRDSINNNKNSTIVTHKIENILDPTNSETIYIQTRVNDGSGYAKLASIEFSTSDLPTYQAWVAYITTNASFVFNFNSHTSYLYKYGFKAVSFGTVTINTTTNVGNIFLQDLSVTKPITYFLNMSYPISP